jgi:pimeloyl-ACP methyl ester carboxylesterase
MPTITRDGIRLAYQEQGSGSPPFVFVHGWTCDRSFFAPQAEHFSKTHRVVSVDLRGHGESDKPEGAYSIAGFADDVAHVIDHLKLGRVIAVGHSMGGITVLQLAAAHPDTVAGIVMVDPAPLAFPPELRAGIEGMVAAIEAGNRDPQRQFVEGHLFLPTSDKALVKRVADVMCGAPAHVAAGAMKAILAFDGVAAAARCKAPALHIAATPPLNPPHQMSQWMPSVVNGWTVGAGHFNQLEAAAQVNGMIEGFLRHHV